MASRNFFEPLALVRSPINPSGHCEGSGSAAFSCRADTAGTARAIGMACESVLGLDVVTADGEQIYCDPEHHPDLYWAARGAGTGFFGVVTSFKLRIHQRPAVVGTCLYMYPDRTRRRGVHVGARTSAAEVDPRVELQILATLGEPSRGQSADHHHRLAGVSPNRTRRRPKPLRFLGTCPVADKAMVNLPYMPTTWRTGTPP